MFSHLRHRRYSSVFWDNLILFYDYFEGETEHFNEIFISIRSWFSRSKAKGEGWRKIVSSSSHKSTVSAERRGDGVFELKRVAVISLQPSYPVFLKPEFIVCSPLFAFGSFSVSRGSLINLCRVLQRPGKREGSFLLVVRRHFRRSHP